MNSNPELKNYSCVSKFETKEGNTYYSIYSNIHRWDYIPYIVI